MNVLQPDDLRELQPHPLAALFPMLPEGSQELADLFADIATNELHTPITLYQGQILDGRHRAAAAIAADLEAWAMEFEGTEDDARAYVMSVNLHRRHLTAEQRRELIKAELKADPTQSDRAIAEKVKVDKNTVALQREKLESGGEIHHLTKRTGKDGKSQAAAKPKKVPVPDGGGGAIDAYHRQQRKAAAEAKAAGEPSPKAAAAWDKAAKVFRKEMGAAIKAGIDVHPVINALADAAG